MRVCVCVSACVCVCNIYQFSRVGGGKNKSHHNNHTSSSNTHTQRAGEVNKSVLALSMHITHLQAHTKGVRKWERRRAKGSEAQRKEQLNELE